MSKGFALQKIPLKEWKEKRKKRKYLQIAYVTKDKHKIYGKNTWGRRKKHGIG